MFDEAEVRNGDWRRTWQGVMLADAANQAGVAHYVYTSMGSAHRHTGIPHFESEWEVEQHIGKIGLPATILRPIFFMENFTTYFKPSPEGILTMPMRADRKLPMVALRDIGQFGAAAFIRSKDFLGEAIDLAGDELTIPEAAHAVNESHEAIHPVPRVSTGPSGSRDGPRSRRNVSLV